MFQNKRSFKKAFIDKLMFLQGKNVSEAAPLDVYKTLGAMIRERVMPNWAGTTRKYRETGLKQVYYFSMEFLLGRLLKSNLLNLGLPDLCREALDELGLNLEEVAVEEPDAGLGNGGLGRLAACFLDSLASLDLPGHGIGIRYKYGLFEQKIKNGCQVELPENWLREGNVWEVRRPEESIEVRFGGTVKLEQQPGRLVCYHEDCEVVRAVPYDMPVIGYGTATVNTLRLWDAEALDSERCAAMDCYRRVVAYQQALESITELLYPDDSHREGKILRLKQQYFLVSAGLQSILSHHKEKYRTFANLPGKVAVHINDTHPALAIPEMMRILMDQEGLPWDQAWEITTQTVSYTNHTTLAEALEKWPVDIFQPLLPRIYQIVEEINRRFRLSLATKGVPDQCASEQMAIIAGGQVRMAPLAIVGSHSVNGVARLHTEILKQREMKEFFAVYPEKFNNKTNGISHRRWLLQANPDLAALITEAIGPEWIRRPDLLERLVPYHQDPSFQEQFRRVKQKNKLNLARMIKQKYGLAVDVNSIFDVQVKRLHAYKRQLLNVLHIMELYNRLNDQPDLSIIPRTFIFGAKAFPNYHLAKKIIKLINTVAQAVNHDRRIRDLIKVVFVENYRVSLAEQIIPAADLSEQISTAGKEASGTGNMKFMLNGAATIGTLDGANIEIAEAVGKDNIFIFGLTANEVLNYKLQGGYCSWDLYYGDPRLKRILDQLVNGFFPAPRDEFAAIYDHLLCLNDEYFVLCDFASYVDVQAAVSRAYQDKRRWSSLCIQNMARAGRFSSDRTIQQYAMEIWGIKPVKEKAVLPSGLETAFRYA